LGLLGIEAHKSLQMPSGRAIDPPKGISFSSSSFFKAYAGFHECTRKNMHYQWVFVLEGKNGRFRRLFPPETGAQIR
jgi:hypothetical protein